MGSATQLNALHIGSDLDLPLEAVTQKFAFLAQSGAGKSYAAMKLAEEMLLQNAQIIALDPVGIWWGLRSSADGKKAGLSIVVFGGEHGDVPLSADAGALVADMLVDEGISAIIDVSDFELPEMKRFVTAFAERFFQRKKRARGAVHIFFEEIQTFAPQTPERDETTMLNRVERLARIGRNYGIGWSAISQRPQETHKKVLNQAGTLFALRTIGKHERKAVSDWVADKAQTETEVKLLGGLPSLETGVARVWSPAFLKTAREVRIGRRRTFDSSATPDVGTVALEARTLAPVDVDRLREMMAATIEKAKAEDPKLLQRRVRELEAQLEQAQRAQKLPSAKAGAYDGAVRDNAELVERNRALEAEVRDLRDQLGGLEWQLGGARENLRLMEVGRDQRLAYMRDARDAIIRIAESFNVFLFDPEAQAVLESIAPREFPPADPSTRRRKAPRPTPVDRPPAPRPVQEQANGKHAANEIPAPAGVKIGKGERKVMAILAQYPNGRTYNELAFLASYSSKASTLGVILANLRRAGYVSRSSNPIQLTELGMATVGHVDPLPSGPELLEHWLRHPRMGQGERTVLQALISVYERPDEPTHEELCELTASFGGPEGGYSPTASTMGVILSKLRKLGLVEKGARRVAREFYESIQEAPQKARARG